MNKTRKFKANTLYYYAEEHRKKATDEEEIERINMTHIFYKELEIMIKEKERISININGKTRGGKSTEAMSIGKHIFKLLKKHGYKKEKEEFGIENIARDQQEYTAKMRDPKTQYTVLVIDEDNELEKTGENVTIERALGKVISDVQAARYVHTIYCSPKEITDENSDILLEVISTDKKTKTTHNKLYYRYYSAGEQTIQLLGHVNIQVNNIIKEWEKIKDVFLKPEQTTKEKRTITETAKKDWFTQYNIRKHEKMELLTKEGIFQPRKLQYAGVILQVVQDLKKIAPLGTTLNKDIIKNYIRMNMRQQKIPQSIIGEELATREANATLELYKSKSKIEQKMQKENTPTKGLQEMKKEIEKAINIQEKELYKYKEINRKYHETQ